MPATPDAVKRFETPLVIGVLSDTHIWRSGTRKLPPEVPDFFARHGAGLILHAGDINDRSVLEELEHVAPVLAVRGNNDVSELQDELSDKLTLGVGTWTIGLVHGHGGRSAREVAYGAFSPPCDLVVYGHSHLPMIENRNNGVFFNPGSPTDRRWGPHFGVGLLHCIESGIDPHLVLFKRARELDGVTIELSK